MFGIGPMELVLILVVALLVLGPKRMPELARTLGKGLGEFRRASHDLRQSLALDEIQNELRDGLASPGTIHKPVKRPEADDRPPQAGDDLTAGADAEEPGEGPDAKHPGELPDDLDPYAHADAHADEDADEDADTASSKPEAAAAADEPTPDPKPTPADEGLGTIPVGRTATPRRTAEPSAPSAAKPASTEDERG